MSQFETAVRPALERMLQGERTFLTTEWRNRLAKYLTYKLLVLDWLGDDPALPPEWAQSFYETGKIPAGVFIWLFHCLEGKWQSDIETEGVGLADINDPRPKSELPINTKSFAVGMGSLFVFAIFSTEVDININFDPLAAAKLWPFEAKLLTWPPYQPISSRQAEFVRHTIERIGESPDVIDERS